MNEQGHACRYITFLFKPQLYNMQWKTCSKTVNNACRWIIIVMSDVSIVMTVHLSKQLLWKNSRAVIKWIVGFVSPNTTTLFLLTELLVLRRSGRSVQFQLKQLNIQLQTAMLIYIFEGPNKITTDRWGKIENDIPSRTADKLQQFRILLIFPGNQSSAYLNAVQICRPAFLTRWSVYSIVTKM